MVEEKIDKKINEEEKQVEEGVCPHGGDYGESIDLPLDECDNCEVFDECALEADKLREEEATQETEAAQVSDPEPEPEPEPEPTQKKTTPARSGRARMRNRSKKAAINEDDESDVPY